MIELIWDSQSVTHVEITSPTASKVRSFVHFVSRRDRFQLCSLIFKPASAYYYYSPKTLPNHLTSLTHLTTGLGYNVLPAIIEDFTRLRSLSIMMDGSETTNDIAELIPMSVQSQLTLLEFLSICFWARNLNGLEYFTGLRAFKLQVDDYGKVEADYIFFLLNLEELHLTRLKITTDIDGSRLPYLTSLVLYNVLIESTELFSSLSSLRSLEISDETFPNDFQEEDFLLFTQLKRLVLNAADDSILPPNLEELELSRYAQFEECTGLTRLVLSRNESNLEQITALRSLRDLTLAHMASSECTKLLATASQLTRLAIALHHGYLKDLIGRVCSVHLTSLQELEISFNSIETHQVADLFSMLRMNVNLRVLTIPIFANDAKYKEAIENLAQLTQLRVLNVLSARPKLLELPSNLPCHVEFSARVPVV